MSDLKIPKLRHVISSDVEKSSDRSHQLLGGSSTVLGATCLGNFEIAGLTRQMVVDAPLEAVIPLLYDLREAGYWLSDEIIEHAGDLANETGSDDSEEDNP